MSNDNRMIEEVDNSIESLEKEMTPSYFGIPLFKTEALSIFELSNYYLGYYNNNIKDIINTSKFRKIITKKETISLAREIIEKINPEYALEFDRLNNKNSIVFINQNLLFNLTTTFTNNEKRYGSNYQRRRLKNKKFSHRIKIDRTYTYNDVTTLIHEFIHYMVNEKMFNNSSFQYFSEFLPIYYETYAIDYLIKEKGIDANDIDVSKRIITNVQNCEFHQQLLIPAMKKLYGEISYDNYLKMTDKYKIENKTTDKKQDFYISMIGYLNYVNYLNVYKKRYKRKISDVLTRYYQHLTGTFYAFYARKNYNLDEVNKLLNAFVTNDFDEKSSEMFHDINDNSFKNNDAFEAMKELVEEYSVSNKKTGWKKGSI